MIATERSLDHRPHATHHKPPTEAQKGDSEKAMGAVVGKAMEPLKEGEGTIVVQVMLR